MHSNTDFFKETDCDRSSGINSLGISLKKANRLLQEREDSKLAAIHQLRDALRRIIDATSHCFAPYHAEHALLVTRSYAEKEPDSKENLIKDLAQYNESYANNQSLQSLIDRAQILSNERK